MVTTEEATPTMKNLNRYVTKKYAADWRDIGIELDLELHTLEIISKDNHHECVPCFQSTLDKWLKLTPDATWKMLEVAITNVMREKLCLDPVDDVYGESTVDDMYLSYDFVDRYMNDDILAEVINYV